MEAHQCGQANTSPSHHPSTYSPHHLPFPPRSIFLPNPPLPLLPKLVPILLTPKVIFTSLPLSLSIIASFSSLTVQLLHVHFLSPITLTFHSRLSSFPLVNGTHPSLYSASSFLLPKQHPAPGSIQCLFYCCSIKYFLRRERCYRKINYIHFRKSLCPLSHLTQLSFLLLIIKPPAVPL